MCGSCNYRQIHFLYFTVFYFLDEKLLCYCLLACKKKEGNIALKLSLSCPVEIFSRPFSVWSTTNTSLFVSTHLHMNGTTFSTSYFQIFIVCYLEIIPAARQIFFRPGLIYFPLNVIFKGHLACIKTIKHNSLFSLRMFLSNAKMVDFRVCFWKTNKCQVYAK